MSPVLSTVLAAPPGAAGAGETTLFWFLAPLMVLGSLGMVFARNAVHAALSLVGVMLILGVFYIAQGAQFLGFVQIIVYAGAIMILFLFVLMLVGVDAADSLVETIRGQRLAAAVLGIAFASLLSWPIGRALADTPSVGLAAANSGGNVAGIGRLLFVDYFFAFETVAALLVIASIGAMVLGHRERGEARSTQREMSKARFAGSHPSPLPGPGVLATSTAVNTPARLPDGSDAEVSLMPEYANLPGDREVVVDQDDAELRRDEPVPAGAVRHRRDHP